MKNETGLWPYLCSHYGGMYWPPNMPKDVQRAMFATSLRGIHAAASLGDGRCDQSGGRHVTCGQHNEWFPGDNNVLLEHLRIVGHTRRLFLAVAQQPAKYVIGPRLIPDAHTRTHTRHIGLHYTSLHQVSF